VRVSLVGIDLITVEARVVVASIETYLKYAEAVGQVSTVSRPGLESLPAPAPAVEEVRVVEREHVESVKRRSRVRKG
jgi:hypothetical protein